MHFNEIAIFKPGNLLGLHSRFHKTSGILLHKDGTMAEYNPYNSERKSYSRSDPPLLFLKMKSIQKPGWPKKFLTLFYFLWGSEIWLYVSDPMEDIPPYQVWTKVE